MLPRAVLHHAPGTETPLERKAVIGSYVLEAGGFGNTEMQGAHCGFTMLLHLLSAHHRVGGWGWRSLLLGFVLEIKGKRSHNFLARIKGAT